jgi:hypothetical protein
LVPEVPSEQKSTQKTRSMFFFAQQQSRYTHRQTTLKSIERTLMPDFSQAYSITIYLYCRSFSVADIEQEEDPRTHQQRIIVIVLAHTWRPSSRFRFLALPPGYPHEEVLIQQLTLSSETWRESIRVVLPMNRASTTEVDGQGL